MSDSISQKISLTRHPEPAEFRLLAKRHERGAVLPSHEHQTGQLVFALRGTMLVETQQSRWTVPPQRALWIPPHQPHAIQILSDVEMRTVYFHPALFTEVAGFARCNDVHAVVASSLIRELVLGLFEQPRQGEMRELMVQLLLHALGEAACLPTHLPMPTNERLRAALMELISGNQWHWSISEIAYRAAMSERTFTRRFSAEVGLNYRTWHHRARIVASLDLLASNRSVKSVAHTLQFASAAAYVAAFRKITGSTPRAFQSTHLMQSAPQ